MGALTREPDTVRTVVGKDAIAFREYPHCLTEMVCNAVILMKEGTTMSSKSQNTKTRSTVLALCEGAVMVALAQVLGYLRLYRMPNGGSITLAMVPIFLYCARWGLGRGLLASFVYSILQVTLDQAFFIDWRSLLGDYILAYTVLGLAGVFRGKRFAYFYGALLGGLARFLVAFVVGATLWGEYAPEEFFGMTMTSPWHYSAIYNGIYIGGCVALCLLVGALLWKHLGRYFRAEDI